MFDFVHSDFEITMYKINSSWILLLIFNSDSVLHLIIEMNFILRRDRKIQSIV